MRHAMTSSKQRVKSLFSERAAEWAAVYSAHQERPLEAKNLNARLRLAQEMLEAEVPPAAKVLDVGCGPGEMAARLTGRGYEVWGLDIAEPMIRYARARCGADRFRVGDAENIPFADNTFDAVICLAVVEYLDADERALREIRRVLKPGGRAVVCTANAVCPLYRMDRVLVRLEAAARPLYYLVKYRLRGRRAPIPSPPLKIAFRRHYRGRWMRYLRSVGLEPEEFICHGWGWYRSQLIGWLVSFLSLQGEVLRLGLERFLGEAASRRIRARFVRNRAFNWLAYEQLVRVRAVK